MTIKAIPTRYRGVLYRSRLEARWAIFFQAAGISFEYEPERVSLGGRSSYLPDFRTNGSGYVEVKGAEEALDKPYLIRAARVLGHLTVLGPVPDCHEGIPGRAVLLATALNAKKTDVALYTSWHDYRPGITRRAYLMSRCTGDVPWLEQPVRPGECTGRCPYDAARGARFEHGQSGAV